MKKDEPYSSLDQLPLTLNADDIAKALNISRGNAYTLLHREDFPNGCKTMLMTDLAEGIL